MAPWKRQCGKSSGLTWPSSTKKEFEVFVHQAEAILDDQRYLQIYIVFDGTAKDLWIPGWTTGLIGRIRDKLADENIMEFPVVSPVAKSEWPALQRTIA